MLPDTHSRRNGLGGAFPSHTGPGRKGESKRAARGFVTGFFRARDVSRPPVGESPAMTRKSARHVSRPATAQTEEQPAPAPSKVRNISLSQLVLSPANVRKTPATAAEEAQLEASIRARGILQNLIVHPTAKASTRSMPAAAASQFCRSLPPRVSSTPIIRSRVWSGNRRPPSKLR
jgi:hypothetical protein